MSGDFFFGIGPGWLPEKAAAIAKRHGADLVNYTDPGCRCGRGCVSGECKSARRHWFVTDNLGYSFTRRITEAVLADLEKERIEP